MSEMNTAVLCLLSLCRLQYDSWLLYFKQWCIRRPSVWPMPLTQQLWVQFIMVLGWLLHVRNTDSKPCTRSITDG